MAKVITFEDLQLEADEKLDEGVINRGQHDDISRVLVRFGNTYTSKEDRDRNVWKFREKIRNRYYREQMVFHESKHTSMWRMLPPSHFVHPSSNKDDGSEALVAYTKDEEKGKADIQTVTRMGKYLTALNKNNDDAHKLSEQAINEFANAYKQERIDAKRAAKVVEKHAEEDDDSKDVIKEGLHISQNPFEIAHAYRTCSTSSCMSYPASKWAMFLGDVHCPDEFDIDSKARIKNFEDVMGKTYTPDEQKLFRHTKYTESVVFPAEHDGYTMKPLIHPTHLFGLTPELGVALNYHKGTVVGRAVVNVVKKTYQKVYGQDHTRVMLQKLGYHHGCVTPFTMPKMHVSHSSSEKTSEDMKIIMPFIDGSNVGVQVPKKKGGMHFISSALKDIKKSATHTHSARNYSTGYLGITNLFCDGCDNNVRSREYLTAMHEKVLCSDCTEKELMAMEDNFIVAWTWGDYDSSNEPDAYECDDEPDPSTPDNASFMYSESKPRLALIEKDDAIEVDNYDLTQIQKQITPHIKYGGTPEITGSVLLELYSASNSTAIREATKKIYEKQKGVFYCSKYCDPNMLVQDCITEKTIMRIGAYKALLPDGAVGYTIDDTVPVKGRMAQKALSFLTNNEGNVRIPVSIDPTAYKSMKLVFCKPRARTVNKYTKGYYAVEDECVEAIVDLHRNKELRPRSLCTYSYSTKTWYCAMFGARTLCRSTLPQPLSASLFSEHDSSFMEANKVVNIALPTTAAVQNYIYSTIPDTYTPEDQDAYIRRAELAAHFYALWGEEWDCAKPQARKKFRTFLLSLFGISKTDNNWEEQVTNRHLARLLNIPLPKQPIEQQVSNVDEAIQPIHS